MVFRNGSILTHESIHPSNDRFTPCVQLTPMRGDLLVTLPSVMYAGMSYKLKMSGSRPSKMVRARVSSTSSDLYFSPEVIYIAGYEEVFTEADILVSASALSSFCYVNISQEESIEYNLYRDNLPQVVEIRNDFSALVIVEQAEACSIGYWIEVPVRVSWPASNDIYLLLRPVN